MSVTVMELNNLSHDHEWIINIRRSLETDFEEENDEFTSITIFSVPRALYSTKPEAYTPQAVALGPYHHRRLELAEMESHKLAAAKKVKRKLKSIKFVDLIAKIAENDAIIRSHYHRYLDFDQQTIAWIFAVDACFIFQCLRTYSDWKQQRTVSFSRRNSLKLGHLMDYTRRKTWHQAVLRDMIMLENQIPLFLVKNLHAFHDRDEDNNRDEKLSSMLMGFCKDLAPIKHIDEPRFKMGCFEKAHLLELLYYTVVPKLPPSTEVDHQEKQNQEENKEIGSVLSCWVSFLINLVIFAPTHILFKICKSKIVMQYLAIPWKIIVHVLQLRGGNSVSGAVISSVSDIVEEAESSLPSIHEKEDSPLVEEIAIPSVSELSRICVKFRPTNGGINSIKFDKCSATLYLPVLHLNENSDVVLRNLVAYEACLAPEAMVFTRYTELMNGIIDTEEDVKILREAGILLNRLKSDEAAASLWNGMTTSVKATKVPLLDKAIEGVNGYYSTSWKVKVKETMKKYVYACWPCLTFLAANVIIFLSVMETVCSVYGCSIGENYKVEPPI